MMVYPFHSVEEALKQSSGWVNGSQNLYGYLPFIAANYLVSTGQFNFHSAGCWGYIVERI